ncbi:hypothetical protein COCMIDRAFT_9064 [Bipolaris oryzae ATCC 44560]|uniref:Uncharacterized protein n=1 Tax=Bipolaris oryzae ATCC 44560 TaxID=930090 RepID=W6Z0K3_COCMI|nr:uncharacterized protein COCMIDRAFT_9064 [Bipolaris oryzae ATCC 44560]EUC41199.1 hypothetical protein COCMIDRAFT_9064 [Bipolaris oryzae ATCC 44560]
MSWLDPPRQNLTPTTDSSMEESSMLRIICFGNELPHDDLQHLMRQLHVHTKDQHHGLVARFIYEATQVLRDEVLQLPTALKSLVPPYESVLDLSSNSELRAGPLGASVDGVLLCAFQLASAIGFYRDSNSANRIHDAGNTCFAGLGIGLLVAAAAASASSLENFVSAGREAVRLAFRLGIVVGEVSRNLHSPSPDDQGGAPESWAYVVPEVTVENVQAELDAFHHAQAISLPSQIFISAFGRNFVTISGPPGRLKHLSSHCDFFRDLRLVPLPVYSGLCHAQHIYGFQYVEAVTRTATFDDLAAAPGGILFSTNTGRPFEADTSRALFSSVIQEILTSVIKWDQVVQGMVDLGLSLSASRCQILVARPSLPTRDLGVALESNLPNCKTETEDMTQWIGRPDHRLNPPRGRAQSKLAIVGMACRMPSGATDTEKFWRILEDGLDVHRVIPADRFNVDTHFDPQNQRMNASWTPYGCFIDEPGLFDAAFFNMSPREAQQTDPMQRLALVTAYEALERAGHVADRTPASHRSRTGTFYGQASDDYREVNSNQEISTYFITGGCRAFGPGRINYFFKFSGPSYSIDTACSSSLATLQMACTSLWSRDTDCAVVGGMNVLTNSDAFAGLSNGHFLSKTPNACKTWDSEADGYCRADGVGSVVIKRLEDAQADNDNILGVILGAGTNHSADAVSITHPLASAQADLTSQIMRQAGVDPLDVSYVEMHGTGTQAGDMQEIQSVADVFAPSARRRAAHQPLHIGAVKSNVGHGEAAAGITALLKVLLMFEHESIPRHVGIKHSLNPAFPIDLAKRNLRIPLEATPWQRSTERKRIAVVNNFSAAGGNSAVLIEEAPTPQTKTADPRNTHVITVSAKSKASLKGNVERLLAYLDGTREVELASLAYTTTARRHHYNYRLAIAASNVDKLKQQLNKFQSAVDVHKPVAAMGPPPVVFAFTGQGASHKSFNLELYHHNSEFRTQISNLNGIAQAHGFPSFLPVIDGSHASDSAHSPVKTQLALLCVEIALTRFYKTLGVEPDVVVGHSLGEYAALHVAGVLTAADAIFLVGHRAAMLESQCRIGSHKMLAVRAATDEISEVAKTAPYEIACVNGPRDTVLSGSVGDIDALKAKLVHAGFKCFDLDVAFAFHSSQTDPILDEFEGMAKRGVIFQSPTIPIISPLLGGVVFDEKTINGEYLRRGTRETVNFLGAIHSALEIGTIDESMIWVEIGPHPVCTAFVQSIMGPGITTAPTLRRGENNWQTVASSLSTLYCAGVNLDWNEFHRPHQESVRLLDLPTYAWNDKNHWLMYNGNWNLTKGNTYYDAEKAAQGDAGTAPMGMNSGFITSTVQRITHETYSTTGGKVVMQSDLMQPDFLAAAWGHQMNDCGVVTSSIHADIAFTLGKYLFKKIRPGETPSDMNVANLHVAKGLVAQKNTTVPQIIQVSITIKNVDDRIADLTWSNVSAIGVVDEPFATANILFGPADSWLSEWRPLLHLVQGRIDTLEHLAATGAANRLSRSMAYTLFAANLVNYADKYRGMQSVILHGLEAVAEVCLTAENSGTWTVPPYFIDSVAHLAGFIMNVSDVNDCRGNFHVTPGWDSLRFAEPLVAGGHYQSYVKMIQTPEDPTVYLGDVYVLRAGIIIGMCGGIKFKRYPRVLLDRFFSAPEVAGDGSHTKFSNKVAVPLAERTSNKPAPAMSTPVSTTVKQSVDAAPVSVTKTSDHKEPPAKAQAVAVNADSVTSKAIALLAAEAQLDESDLSDDARFENLGVDSLMSLVIAEKLRKQLGVTVNGSLFLEYPTLGDLRAWLNEYYS